MRAVQDPVAVANWAAYCPHVREALRECVAEGSLPPIPGQMDMEQMMEWLSVHFDSTRGRAELAEDLMADWRESKEDLEDRTACATALCGMLDELPGPVLSDTGQSREVAEQALAHVIRNKAEATYARSDLFDRRRRLMDAWASYLSGYRASVVPIRPPPPDRRGSTTSRPSRMLCPLFFPLR